MASEKGNETGQGIAKLLTTYPFKFILKNVSLAFYIFLTVRKQTRRTSCLFACSCFDDRYQVLSKENKSCITCLFTLTGHVRITILDSTFLFTESKMNSLDPYTSFCVQPAHSKIIRSYYGHLADTQVRLNVISAEGLVR